MAPKQLKPQTSLTLRHEMPYYSEMPKDIDVFEGGPQQLVLATVDGYDLLFWISPYMFEGKTPKGFLGQDAVTLHTMLLMVPTDKRGSMHDTDFHCRGWNPSDYLKTSKDLKVTATKDRVIWKLKDTEFVSRPPYWEVRGKNEGIAYDLKVTGTAPTSWFIGDFNKIKETKIACFDQFTHCTGTITVGKKTYKITNGYGTHEHPINAASPTADAFSHQMHWIIGGGDALQFFTFVWGDPPQGYGRIVIDGKYLACTDVNLDVLEWWHDPQSLATIPSKWHISMRCPEGIFDVHAVASGRANYLWCLNKGYVLNNWLLGTVNGAFMRPNGRTTPIKDLLFEVQWNRTIVATG